LIIVAVVSYTRLRSEFHPNETPALSVPRPGTVAEVVGLLGKLENAKLLAGGQSLMPMLNMRFVLPDHVTISIAWRALVYQRSGGVLENRRHDPPA